MASQLELEQIFAETHRVRPYQGQALSGWLEKWLTIPAETLAKANQSFLTNLTTWVVRKAQQRRKGGVPVGHLETFCLPADKNFNLVETLAAHIVSVFRKRGLVEVDRQSNKQFELLVEALNRAEYQKGR
jgi:hypothetical protein